MIHIPDEHDELIEKLNAYLPLEVSPTRALVQAIREKHKITLQTQLFVTSFTNLKDAGGVICAIDFGEEVVASSLTHLIVKANHPLYQEILAYQTKRIKKLKKEGNWQ